MSDEQMMRDYCQSYFAVHGDFPVIMRDAGGRFRIDTKTGTGRDYTRRDVKNLLRGLKAMAARRVVRIDA
ncbi:MAG: hypothetical protein APF82_00850 [Sphingomonadales bacterium BRH_c42]|nr:MAG: hypothetical protein APF82_00850 [Sphingomonadales bacterium BRH_c42]